MYAVARTLSADEDEGDFCSVSVVRHLGVEVVDGLETRLVLEAEHEDDGVHPVRELRRRHSKVALE